MSGCIRKNTGENPGLSRVVRRDLPMVVQGEAGGQFNPILGRAMFFGVPANESNASLAIANFDRARECVVEEIGGTWRATTKGQVPRDGDRFVFQFPARDKPRLFGLSFGSAPDTVLDATSQVGTDGIITILAPDVNVEAGLTQLAVEFAGASSLLRPSCAVRAGDTREGSFVVAKRRGVPRQHRTRCR